MFFKLEGTQIGIAPFFAFKRLDFDVKNDNDILFVERIANHYWLDFTREKCLHIDKF